MSSTDPAVMEWIASYVRPWWLVTSVSDVVGPTVIATAAGYDELAAEVAAADGWGEDLHTNPVRDRHTDATRRTNDREDQQSTTIKSRLTSTNTPDHGEE